MEEKSGKPGDDKKIIIAHQWSQIQAKTNQQDYPAGMPMTPHRTDWARAAG